jgi:type I restriction enzyme M protein
MAEAATGSFQSLEDWTRRVARDWQKPCAAEPAAQRTRLAEMDGLARACRALLKEVDLVAKLATRLIEAAENDANAKNHDEWDARAIARLEKGLEPARKALAEQLKQTIHFERQADWLLSRFPDAQFVAVPGLCRIVSRKDIEGAEWSLAPGRHVGVAPKEIDEEFDFEQTLRDIHVELGDLDREAAALAVTIQDNFEALGI